MPEGYQKNDEARMSNAEESPNPQMTKVLREVLFFRISPVAP